MRLLTAVYAEVDVTERSIPQRKCDKAQMAEYSGKKKDHTVKNLVIINSRSPSVILPYKKPKNKGLPKFQKSINKGISKECVLIENVFARMKRLKIIRNKIYNSEAAKPVTGIRNLGNALRNPLLNYSQKIYIYFQYTNGIKLENLSNIYGQVWCSVLSVLLAIYQTIQGLQLDAAEN